MSNSVRCKFRCNEVNTRVDSFTQLVDDLDNPGRQKYETTKKTVYGVKMTPVYSDKPDSENKKFWEYTPTGLFEMGSIHNGMFTPGKDYYIDISEAPEE